MKNEKALTLAQLDRVNGGTAAEYNEIIDTMISLDHTTTVSFAGILRGLRGGSLFLNAMAPVIALQLKRFYGIDATLSTGIMGFFSHKNSYSRDGVTLTHNEVLDIIRREH